MLAKLLSNHLHNDFGKLLLLLVIQGKYHFYYLFNFRSTLHLLSPAIRLIGTSLLAALGEAASIAFTVNIPLQRPLAKLWSRATIIR